MSSRQPSLASKPFVNLRPVRRATALLWVLGLILLALNVVMWRSYFTSSDDRERDLASTNAAIESNQQRLETAQQLLAELDLPAQNAQVDFLNRRIAQRVFGWSELFDEMEQVLPNDVRLLSLSPREVAEGSDRGGLPANLSDVGDRIPIRLTLKAIAKNPNAQLELLNRLFKSPVFVGPILRRESVETSGQVQFDLETIYLATPLSLPPEPNDAALVGSEVVRVDVDGDGTPAGFGNDRRANDRQALGGIGPDSASDRAPERLVPRDPSVPPGNPADRRAGRAAAPSTTDSPATEPLSPRDQRRADRRAARGADDAEPQDRRSEVRQQLLDRLQDRQTGGGDDEARDSSTGRPVGVPSVGTAGSGAPASRRLSASSALEPQ